MNSLENLIATPLKRRSVLASASALTIASLSGVPGITTLANAQSTGLPDKPIRLVTGVPAGGVPDIICRLIADEMQKNTGHSMLVDNKTGAGGLVAVNSVMGAPHDGTSLVLAETGSYAIAPHLTKLNPFESSMVPVALVATAPVFLTVNSNLGVSNIQEFIALAKSKPGMPYGSSGNGSAHHLSMELLKSMSGIQLTHVPYRGAAQVAVGLVANDVNAAFLGLGVAQAQAKSGKVKIIGVAAAKRSALAPDVPAIGEVVPGYDVAVTLGFYTPADTPPAVISRLNAELTKAVMAPSVRERLASSGVESVKERVTPAQYAVMVKKEYETYGKIVSAANLKLD